MEKTLYDKNGDAVAYISSDYHETIYLWDGSPVAYLYEEEHVYGINGRHLGWFIGDILFDNNGKRIAFTSGSCPVTITKEPVKIEKRARDEIQPRWAASPRPKLSFDFAEQEPADLFRDGEAFRLRKEEPPEESEDSR
ncbi:hypothetical protein OAC89_01025 [Deltaproteobacteria bacterium]|nr:hypothetical protein [Deltaproteobacteria bacterium]